MASTKFQSNILKFVVGFFITNFWPRFLPRFWPKDFGPRFWPKHFGQYCFTKICIQKLLSKSLPRRKPWIPKFWISKFQWAGPAIWYTMLVRVTKFSCSTSTCDGGFGGGGACPSFTWAHILAFQPLFLRFLFFGGWFGCCTCCCHPCCCISGSHCISLQRRDMSRQL